MRYLMRFMRYMCVNQIIIAISFDAVMYCNWMSSSAKSWYPDKNYIFYFLFFTYDVIFDHQIDQKSQVGLLHNAHKISEPGLQVRMSSYNTGTGQQQLMNSTTARLSFLKNMELMRSIQIWQARMNITPNSKLKRRSLGGLIFLACLKTDIIWMWLGG